MLNNTIDAIEPVALANVLGGVSPELLSLAACYKNAPDWDWWTYAIPTRWFNKTTSQCLDSYREATANQRRVGQ